MSERCKFMNEGGAQCGNNMNHVFTLTFGDYGEAFLIPLCRIHMHYVEASKKREG